MHFSILISSLMQPAGHTQACGRVPIDEWQKVMDINTRGTFLCCQAVGRVMLKQKKRPDNQRILCQGQIRPSFRLRSLLPQQRRGGYFDTPLACEWAKSNVLVNAVAPTIVETDLTKDALADPAYANR